MEKNEETTMEERVKLKINGGLRSTYLKFLCFEPSYKINGGLKSTYLKFIRNHLMEAYFRSFYEG